MARLTDEELAAMSSLDRRTATSQRNLNDRIYNLRSARTARELRLGREIVEDLASLGPAPKPPTLRKEEPRGGIPAARGYVERAYQPGNDTGTAGIASPLTEQERVYADEPIYVEAMDGSGYFRVRPIVQMKMTDAENREIVFDFADRAGSL